MGPGGSYLGGVHVLQSVRSLKVYFPLNMRFGAIGGFILLLGLVMMLVNA